jgi:type IV pilus assembly protein PilW
MNRQLGLSLIEILVAGVLSALVLTGLLQVVSSVKNSQKLNDALGESQEVGRFVLNLLTDEIVKSGYYGCLKPFSYSAVEEASVDWTDPAIITNKPYINPVVKPDTYFASTNLSRTSLRGFEVSASGGWTPDPSADAYNADILALKNASPPRKPPKADSDVINVQFASRENAPLSENMATKSSEIKIDVKPNGLGGIAQSTFLIIADCALGDLFKVSNVPAIPVVGVPMVLQHDSTVNQTAELRNLYEMASAQVRRFHSDTYYVVQTDRLDAMGNPISALMRMNVKGVPEELAEGVEKMNIEYGQQAANGSLQYLKAGSVANMRRVTQIKITVDTKTVKSREGAGNGYLTKQYTRTIKLRNRS